MLKDYEKIGQDELLKDLKINLENFQKEKDRLEIERGKLKAEMALYRQFKQDYKKYENKYEYKYNEVSKKVNNFSLGDIEYDIIETQELVSTLENIMELKKLIES